MDSQQIEHLKGLCVINLTKYLIEKLKISHEEAYKKLLKSETYTLLMNEETNLFLESDLYLIEALNIEFSQGEKSLLTFLSKE